MPTWSKEQLIAYEARRASSRAQPEPAVPAKPVAASEREAGDPSRLCVRITSFRVRLLDPDNLCPKYFIDCCRYAQIIPDDSPEHIILEMRQVKVKSKSEQHTEIEIL